MSSGVAQVTTVTWTFGDVVPQVFRKILSTFKNEIRSASHLALLVTLS